MREEFGYTCLGGELDSAGQRVGFCHLGEILLHRHVGAEMQVFLQFVAVNIPHAVEIAGSEPVGVKNLLRLGTSDAVEQKVLELIVGEAVLFSGTDIVVSLPELLRHFGSADSLQKPPAVLHRGPFQNAPDRDMEHDRVVVLQYSRIEYSGLAEGDPFLDSGVGNDSLRLHFGQSVMVISRHAYRVSGPSPMKRFPSVAHLRHRTYIYHFGLLVVGLRQYGFGDVLRCRYVGPQRSLGTVVRLRRDHSSYMEHYVCSADSFQHVFVLGQVSPDNTELRVPGVEGLQQFFVLLAGASQNPQLIAVRVFQDLRHTGIAHGARSTG